MRIGYERVSTLDQHPEAQGDRLREDGCERIYTDRGESGRKASRPQWDACLADLRKGDMLVVVRLDRMGRSVRNLIEVADLLRERGADLRVLDQGVDTSTPAGRFFFHVLAALAEMEADILRERTMDGLQAARARGRVGGGKPKLSAAQTREVKKMFAEGRRPAEILALFPISRATLYRIVGTDAA